MLNCKDFLHPSLHTDEATKLITDDTKFQSWFLVDTLLISCSKWQFKNLYKKPVSNYLELLLTTKSLS